MGHGQANSWRACSLGIRLAAAAALGVPLAACTQDLTPPPPTHPVEAYVFYDENGNLTLDASELARVPAVDITIGGRTGRSELRTGHTRIENVPEGQQIAEAAHLPPYYVEKVAPGVNVPTTEPVLVPLQLDIGSNHPNVYMAFGDSITDGLGSGDGLGYREKLQRGLVAHFGVGTVVNEGISGTRSGKARPNDALARIDSALAAHRPAYTLILYGTNDWNDATCKYDENCQTVENLRAIVRAVRAAGSLPVLGTILPSDPAYPVENPPARNAWIDRTNQSLRVMAQSEGVVVADLYAVFMAQSDLAALFWDHVHPNDVGYELIANGFLRAITGDVTATTPAANVTVPVVPSESLQLLPLNGATSDVTRDGAR
jgi:lysophospholipase L1-like esterase